MFGNLHVCSRRRFDFLFWNWNGFNAHY